MPARCSGTGRWERSSSSRSPPAPGRSPRRVAAAPGVDRRRRWRLGRRDPAVRAGGQGDARVDRRRRRARADRGQRRCPGRARRSAMSDAGRTPLIAGNWKMNKTVAEAEEFIQALLPRVSTADGVDVAICPPFTALTRDGRLDARLARRRCSRRTCTTGESAPTRARSRRRCWSSSDVHGVILGHSERRELFGETDKALALKVPAALDTGSCRSCASARPRRSASAATPSASSAIRSRRTSAGSTRSGSATS